MTEAPFPVRWQPVVTLLELDSAIRPAPLKDTLKRKEVMRPLLISDLVARLEPEGQLATDIRPAQEEFVAAGGTYETFV